MGNSRYSPKEIAERGKAIYETQLKSQLEPEHTGKFLLIDIETGEYEFGEDDLAISLRAAKQKPGGARFGMRIGHKAWGKLRGKRVHRPS